MGEQVAAGLLIGGVAQLGEHLPCKQGVKSSNLSISTQIMKRAAAACLTETDASHSCVSGCFCQTGYGYSKNIRD